MWPGNLVLASEVKRWLWEDTLLSEKSDMLAKQTVCSFPFLPALMADVMPGAGKAVL